ncbi:MAG: UbiA prenyltransferase family protein [Clostridiales bacterium]|nr:UbiA prenyltransferase family protein [Clostridiales bacterium]
MLNYVKIARPDHWVKNIFIFPGVMLALLIVQDSRGQFHLLNIIIGFCATCMIASANYVINEWLDADFDKFHPTKKNRPVVTGNMKLKYVLAEYFLLASLGITFALFINRYFIMAEIWLLVMGIIYNVKPFRTKDIVFLDVITESVNNMIRLLLGWFLITDRFFPPASILLGYWMAGAFLMGTKRLAEYKMIGNPKLAGQYRKSFIYYNEKILFGTSFFYALCATFFIGIFLVKYRIEYLLAMPALFALFAYYITLAYNDDSSVQKPEKLYKEKGLLSIIAVIAVLLVILTVVEIPILHKFISPYLINIP